MTAAAAGDSERRHEPTTMTVRATAAIDSEPGSTPVFTAVLGSRQRPGPHISRHTCTAMPQRCHVYNRTHLEFPVGERQRRAGYLRPTTHTPTLSQTHAHTHTPTHTHTHHAYTHPHTPPTPLALQRAHAPVRTGRRSPSAACSESGPPARAAPT